MINIKTAIQNNRSLIGASIIGYGIVYLLTSKAIEYQNITMELNRCKSDTNALFGILEREGIIQNVKIN
nr:MAG TPA: hypothetical protein [Caudoviricetes sp.]